MANKTDLVVLVKELNEQVGISLNKSETETTVNNVLDAIKQLSKEDKLRLAGFGDFETVTREARKGLNPKKLAELKAQGLSDEEAKAQSQVDIDAKRAPKFKFAKGFKDYVK